MILCLAGPFGMMYGLCPAGPFQLVHHPNQPVHMGLGSILSGRLMWADAMLCAAGPYGIVQRFFRLAQMIRYDIMFGRSIWDDMWPSSGQSISTGTPSQPASPYGIVLNLIQLAHMG